MFGAAKEQDGSCSGSSHSCIPCIHTLRQSMR
jgi:hypothetical protein